MIRIVLWLILVMGACNATVIKKVELLEAKEKNLSISDIKASKEFKRTKLPIIRHSKNDYFIKITFDEALFSKDDYIIELYNEINFVQTEFENEISQVFRNKIIEINSHDIQNILFVKVVNNEQYVNFDIDVYEKNAFIEKQILLNKLFGIAYGIIFTAFLYYLALYFFNREKTHIYYALTQLSMLFILIFVSFRETENDGVLMDGIFLAFFIFSNLFTQYFLNTKVNTPVLHKILYGSIYLYLLELILIYIFDFSFLEDNIPLSFLMVTYLVAGLRVYSMGYKPALFYLIGWGIVIISFIHIESQFYFSEKEFFIKPLYLMHVITPLESLILAFALSYKMKMLENERNEQKELALQQNKLASMGEMIANIAHQWRQPLTHLSYILMNLKTAYAKNRLSSEYFDKKTNEATEQLEYMSHTIDDFRNFFKLDKKQQKFCVNECIDEVLHLLKDNVKNNGIDIKVVASNQYYIHSLRGEFVQVMFNLLNNAKQALLRNNIEHPHIMIQILSDNEHIIVNIKDNALGVNPEIIEKIFEPYFTTKEDGLGLGLYMSKMIVEKNMKGQLSIYNTQDGACFSIKLKAI